jgi:hypothetical protein
MVETLFTFLAQAIDANCEKDADYIKACFAPI